MAEPRSPAEIAERRRYRRHPIRLEATLRAEGFGPWRCVIQNFSSRGLQLRLEVGALGSGETCRLERGALVEVAFRLPPDRARVKARALAVQVRREGSAHLVGVQFGQCNAFVLDQLLRLSRELTAREADDRPSHHLLVRDLYATLLARVEEAGENEAEHAPYFYALMALRSHEQRISDHLGRVLARSPGPPFELALLLQPFQIAFRESRISESAQALVESAIADLAEQGARDPRST